MKDYSKTIKEVNIKFSYFILLLRDFMFQINDKSNQYNQKKMFSYRIKLEKLNQEKKQRNTNSGNHNSLPTNDFTFSNNSNGLESTLFSIFQQLDNLKMQIQNHNIRKDPKEIQFQISNNLTKFKLDHGRQFQQILDPRDQVLEHNFDKIFSLNSLNLEQAREDFLTSSIYKDILEFVRKFLVETVSNIVSIAFSHLINGRLEQSEAKCFTAKNILLNIQSVFRQIFRSIQRVQIFKDSLDFNKIKMDMIEEIELMLTNIFQNLQGHYPQAQPSGGSQRMKSVIYQVNRVENQENDLIYANNIKISQYIDGSENFTKFIMTVVNTAIKVTQQSENDVRERTIKEKFTEFNEHLFYKSQNKEFKQLIKGKYQQKQSKIDQNKKLFKDFLEIASNEKIQQSIEKKVELQQKQSVLQSLRKQRIYQIGQKIPIFVKQFTKQEILEGKFTAKHSSILRILTKWSEYLEAIFQNPNKQIRNRLYPFKTTENQLLVNSSSKSIQKLKKTLIDRLVEQYKEVKRKFQLIKQKKSELISHILSNENNSSFPSNICRFSQTRKASSKINASLTALMVDYISILIYHLLKAGSNIQIRQQQSENINLIVFRVSDLMRAKFQCKESSFITVVKTLYMLDQQKQMRKYFKLVRIKNKLDDPANNIMINFMFMGKIQCQLQLSIQQPKGKEKSYYTFSHFVYELVRGKFGSIAECAIMISQLDPMMIEDKTQNYKQKYTKKPKLEEYSNQKKIQKKQKFKKNLFECKECQQFVIQNVHQNILSNQQSKKCRKCFLQGDSLKQLIRNNGLRKQLNRLINDKLLMRIKDLSELKNEKDDIQQYPYIMWINNKEKVEFGLIYQEQIGWKHYLIQTNHNFFSITQDSKQNFDEIDYLNFDKDKIMKKFISNNIIYQINTNIKEQLEQLYNNISQFSDLKEIKIDSIQRSLQLFKEYQKEKHFIKLIKQKSQILICGSESKNIQILKNIIDCLVGNNEDTQIRMQRLKYKKHKTLQLSKIRNFLFRDDKSFQFIPQSFSQFSNMKFLQIVDCNLNKFGVISGFKNLIRLNLTKNNMNEVNGIESLSNLKYLNLSSNNIGDVDPIATLTKLQELLMSKNNIIDITNLKKLTNIKKIRIRSNKISKIQYISNDKFTKQLINLKDLNLGENQIKKIEIIQLLKNVQKLYLANNQLENIECLKSLIKIKALNLSGNQIEKIEPISLLINIQMLDLTKNKIESIECLKSLINLKELHVGGNRIEKIEPISLLINIQILDLSKNKINSIQKLLELPLLQSLKIQGNANLSLQDIPKQSIQKYGLI